MSVEPEVEYRPEGEFTQEVEIPAETCEGGSGAARPTIPTPLVSIQPRINRK